MNWRISNRTISNRMKFGSVLQTQRSVFGTSLYYGRLQLFPWGRGPNFSHFPGQGGYKSRSQKLKVVQIPEKKPWMDNFWKPWSPIVRGGGGEGELLFKLRRGHFCVRVGSNFKVSYFSQSRVWPPIKMILQNDPSF